MRLRIKIRDSRDHEEIRTKKGTQDGRVERRCSWRGRDERQGLRREGKTQRARKGRSRGVAVYQGQPREERRADQTCASYSSSLIHSFLLHPFPLPLVVFLCIFFPFSAVFRPPIPFSLSSLSPLFFIFTGKCMELFIIILI